MVLNQSLALPSILEFASNCSSSENYRPCNSNIQDDIIDSNADVGYHIQELPGRGYGLVATKKFYPGDLIIREKPIIDMPDKIFR